jgi:hypothetical protein
MYGEWILLVKRFGEIILIKSPNSIESGLNRLSGLSVLWAFIPV